MVTLCLPCDYHVWWFANLRTHLHPFSHTIQPFTFRLECRQRLSGNSATGYAIKTLCNEDKKTTRLKQVQNKKGHACMIYRKRVGGRCSRDCLFLVHFGKLSGGVERSHARGRWTLWHVQTPTASCVRQRGQGRLTYRRGGGGCSRRGLHIGHHDATSTSLRSG